MERQGGTKNKMKKRCVNHEAVFILATMLAVLLIRVTLYANSEIGAVMDDSPSFIDYNPVAGGRTLGYPLIIDIFQMVFPKKWEEP